MEFYFLPITRDNFASFLVYMLPQAAAELLNGKNDILAVGASTEVHSLGAVVLKQDGDEIKILSLYLDETARRLGISTALLERALTYARERWGTPVKVSSSYILSFDAVQSVDGFFTAQGFDVQTDTGRRVFSINTFDVREQRLWKRVFSPEFTSDEHVVPFSVLTTQQLKEIDEDTAIPDFLKPSNAPGHIHPSISSAWVSNGHALGCILFYIGFDDEVVLLSAFSREGAGLTAFRSMLTSSLNRAYYMLGRHFVLHIHTVNPRAAGLVERLTQNQFIEYASHTAVKY